MQDDERSFAAIAQDIVASIQEIISLEIKLARTEIAASVLAMRQAAVWISAGALTSLFAVALLLLAAVYGLSLVMPPWAAALTVGGTTGLVALTCVMVGIKHIRNVGMPKRTIASLQENVS